MGHAYSSIVADVIARFKRLEGYEVFFLPEQMNMVLKYKERQKKIIKIHNSSVMKYQKYLKILV